MIIESKIPNSGYIYSYKPTSRYQDLIDLESKDKGDKRTTVNNYLLTASCTSLESTVPAPLETAHKYIPESSGSTSRIVKLLLVSPSNLESSSRGNPSVRSHENMRRSPSASTEKVTSDPGATPTASIGWVVMMGGVTADR